MVVETVKVDLPEEVVESARKIGMTVDDLRNLMRRFVILDVVANLSRLDEEAAETLARKIKESAWEKTKKHM